ncbi:septum formation initiator family protein [Patescibacteria group bacterium]|nr:septum formation initiator family protein [Patescibacteria group bacterium]
MVIQRRKTIWQSKSFVRALMASGLVLIIFTSFGLGKEIVRRKEINQEIETTKKEIESLEKKNKELAQMIEYIETDSFKEIQARQNLGFQKEGEVAVSIETNSGDYQRDNSTTFASPPAIDPSNPKRWWRYFFAAK